MRARMPTLSKRSTAMLAVLSVTVLAACLLLATASRLSGCVQAPEPPAKELVVRFLDVGQGDSCLISLPDGKTMLIDAGPASARDGLVKSISGLDIKKLDYIVFTQPHEDHIGGGPAVLKAFDAGRIYMPRTTYITVTYENLLNAIAAEGLTVNEAKAGLVMLSQPEIDLRAVFIGPGKPYEEVNDALAVVALKYRDRTFLFEGDAGFEAEEAMLLSSVVAVPKADVLKVAHHGSATSTGKGFLSIVSPTTAVISVGAGNEYGHPAQSTLDRLAQAKATIYRTDKDGTIVISTDGSKLEVCPPPRSRERPSGRFMTRPRASLRAHLPHPGHIM